LTREKNTQRNFGQALDRNGLSANYICQLATVSDFKEYKESNQGSFPFWEDSWDELDIGGGCGDSCEVYADEK
jgi:hypothetical protein